MRRKSLGNSVPTAINRYINSAYDNVLRVAENIEHVNTVAENIEYITTYLGAYGEAPTTRPDGSPLETGDFYYDDKATYYYEASDDTWTEFNPEELITAATNAVEAAAIAEEAKDIAVDAADKAFSLVGGTDVGDYEDDSTINVITDYVVFGRGTPDISLWKAEESVNLPYTVNSTLYSHPSDDPNLRAYTSTANLYTYEETTYLTDGQLLVEAQSELTDFVVYIWDAASGERHKLDVVYDYTTTESNQIQLQDTYPVGSIVTIVFEDIGQSSDTYLKKQEAEQKYGDHSKQANRGSANAHPASSINQTNGRSVQHYIDNTGIQGEWISGTSYAYKDSEWWLDGVLYRALQNTTVDPVGDEVNWRIIVGQSTVAELSGLTFNTVADMVANGAPVGSKVQWLGYYTQSDGGSNWGVVKSGAHTEDGFSIFSIDSNTYIEANITATGRWSVMKAGAMSTDPDIARQAVQTVYDYPLNGRTVYWPKHNYVFTPPSVGTGAPVFTNTRNLSTKGEETRGSTVRIDGADSETDIFEVGITSNGGFLDVRSWEFKNMSMFFNGSGRHCIRKINSGGALPMFNSEISHCTLASNFDNGGRAIQIDGGWAFSHVRMCDLNGGITAENIADGNKFGYNNISGKGWGIILRVISGAYKTKVYGGTIVTRDGSVWVKTGAQVDIDGVQMEQDAAEGVNQDPISSHIYIQGDSYRSNSCKITNCNLGGGTNVQNLIYLDKCSNTIIDGNFGNAPNPNGYDIVMTSLARFNKVMKSNRWRGNVSNPRTTDRMNAVISDSGRGNYGVLKDLSTLTFLNSWAATGNYYKDPETGEVIILGSFSGGTTTAGSAVADFPNGFRPDSVSNYPSICDAGLFTANMSIEAGTLGRLRIGNTGNAPSNVGVFEGLKYFAQGDDEFTTS